MHAGIWRTVTHCFSWLHVYIMLILLPWDLSTLRIVDHLWLLIIRFLLGLLSSLVLITCNCTSCTHVYELAQNHCGDKSLIIVIIVCWRIDSFIFFAKKAIYSLRVTKPAFPSSKLAEETPKMPNLLKVSNKNVQMSKFSKMFFSGTSIPNFEHIFAFRVTHLTVIYPYFFTTEWIFKPARIVLNHAWYQYSPCILRFIKKLNQLNPMQRLQFWAQYVDYQRKTLHRDRLSISKKRWYRKLGFGCLLKKTISM